MPRSNLFKIATASGMLACAGLVFTLPSPAVAQKKPAKTSTKAKAPAKSKGSWIKLCQKDVPISKDKKDEVCEVMQAKLHPISGKPQAAITMRFAKSDAKKVALAVTVPHNMILNRGVSLFIDEDKQAAQRIPFSHCNDSGCLAVAPTNSIVLNQLRKSGNVKVVTMVINGKQYVEQLSLQGFSKAYDGKPMDPKEFAKARQQLSKYIRGNQKKYVEKLKAKRAEAAKKKAGEKPKKK